MLTLAKLISLPVWLSTLLITHALAAPAQSTGFIDEDKKTQNLNFAAMLTGGESCSDKQLKAIKSGFADMNLLFASAQNPDFENGAVEVEFFGRPTRIANYTELITANLQRAMQYGVLKDEVIGNGTKMPDIHVRCDDPNDMCDGGRNGKHKVYNIANAPHVNFCRRYFELDGLEEKVDDRADDDAPKRLNLWKYYNRGAAWARMIMHISEVGQAVVATTTQNRVENATTEWITNYSLGPMNTSVLAGVHDAKLDTNGPNNIRLLKYAYGVTRSKLLASLSTQDPYDAVNNADNYALYALARYVMQQKGFFPNMPIMDFGNDMAVLTNEMIQDGDKKKQDCFEMPDVVPLMVGVNRTGGALPSSAPARVRTWSGPSIAMVCVVASILSMSTLV
ncbi:hypothetical protein CC80DRAFT_278902 [Byssothecium circinans]|uniref:Uncharacterized protein n=1 Tax=Byssothecium circinans TaxID=147558 RepID=A0A6A5TJU8_9PLEO|nr:hypothetical protein CC80DRAFT_278902 [Byssothecium circinans]